MQKYILSALAAVTTFALSSALPARAAQPSAADIVDTLTCNVRLAEQQLISHVESSWFRKAGAVEDGFELVKPVESEGVCIKQAKIVGAFGVFVVEGQVCDRTLDALKAFF